MKTIGSLLHALVPFAGALLTAGSLSAAAPASRPNVIFIMTDDEGSVDAGCYGAKDLVTPNIDALAARGVRFTQFYSASPVCSPSRAAMLTGRYPVRCGVPSIVASWPGAAGGLPSAEITMAETFKAAGYATALIGKWHLGQGPEQQPNAQGFGHAFGHLGGCIDNYSHYFYWHGPNRHDLYRNGQEVFYDGRYFPDLMVREASQFLEQHRERPFFLYFAINNPHYPYQPDAKWADHFKGLPYPRNLYAAFMASMDERIGALLRKIDDLGLRDQTIVVLQSDNGHSTEERGHYGGGAAGPYRGAKFSLFEGGIRLPGMISWPGRIPAGETRGQLAHGCDWLPTLAELTGVPLLDRDIDGFSLTGVLASAAAPGPHHAIHWQVGTGPKAQWAVREGDWKLIANANDTTDGRHPEIISLFLANLAEDVGERKNFEAAHPDIVAHLRTLHDSWILRAITYPDTAAGDGTPPKRATTEPAH